MNLASVPIFMLHSLLFNIFLTVFQEEQSAMEMLSNQKQEVDQCPPFHLTGISQIRPTHILQTVATVKHKMEQHQPHLASTLTTQAPQTFNHPVQEHNKI